MEMKRFFSSIDYSVKTFNASYSFCKVLFFPDMAWEREILSLRVKCKQSERGCDWTGQLRHYEVTVACCM